MQVIETISLSGPVMPDQFPVPPQEIKRVLQKEGLAPVIRPFEIVMRDDYDPEKYSKVKTVVMENGWDVDLSHTAIAVFSDEEIASAELLSITFPTVWINDINLQWTCSECNEKRSKHDYSVRVRRVPSNLPMASVNGQFKIVRKDIRKKIEPQLTGAEFFPFDEKEKYYHFGATSSLGPLVIHNDEVIDYEGECTKCGFPVFRILFGPDRYQRARWDGQDIVHSEWLADNVVSQSGYQLLHSLCSGVEIFAPVALEG